MSHTKARLRGAAVSLTMMATGGMVALTPAAVLAIASRLFTAPEQAAVAIAIATGAFLAAVIGAATLESRLADPTLSRTTYIPCWATAIGISGGAALAIFPTWPPAICFALPAIMISLQLGRLHATNESAWRAEIFAAVVLGVGVALGFSASLGGHQFSLAPVGLGAGFAAVARAARAPRRPDRAVSARSVRWVTSETAVVAAVPYATSFAILGFLGPADTVAFRLILSTLGVLQPILGYLRTRLLRSSSPALVIGVWGLSSAALGAVLVFDLLGVFGLIFGEAWNAVTLPSLAAACMWKLLTIPETEPFAALRRRGSVATVFAARVAASVLTLSLTFVTAALFGTLFAVFIAFAVSQVLTVLLYIALDHRDRSRAGLSD